MAQTQNYGYNFPYFPPPPPPPHYFPSPPKVSPTPHHPSTPPPPPPHHISPPPLPPPHVVPPPPPPGHHSTVIIIVFISVGSLFLLAFLAAALCCFIMKKKKRSTQETDVIRVDEHMKVHEAIIQGPHGAKAVILTIDEDLDIQEEIKKEEMVGKGLHMRSAKDSPQALAMTASTSNASVSISTK